MFDDSASKLSQSPLIDEFLRRELRKASKSQGAKSNAFPVLVKFKKDDTCFENGTETLNKINNNHSHCEIKRSLPRLFLQSGKLTAEALDDLCTNCEDIEKVYLDREYNALLDTASNTTRATELQKEKNATGEDVTIAIIDTGVYPSADLMQPTKRVIGFKDFVNDRISPYDDNGHGTHCAGDAAGNGYLSNGKYAGPAPKANIVGVKVLNWMGAGALSNILAGIDWCVENKEKYNIRILSLSLGGTAISATDDPMVEAVNEAWKEGMVVCVAAGNEGPVKGTIASPGISEKVITVGALDDKQTSNRSDDGVADFSSRGPTPDRRTKPDILAPGVDIVSLRSPYSYLDLTSRSKRINQHYTTMSGTSMATPICAGVCAQLLELNKNLTPDEVKRQLLENAENLGLDPHIQGKGSLDAIKSAKQDNTEFETGHSILGETFLSPNLMNQYVKSINSEAIEIANYYLTFGEYYGIRGDIAFSQAMHETDFLRFTGVVQPEQNNFCGLGATGPENPGTSFKTPAQGVLAHIQHLYAYATKEPLPDKYELIDPHFDLVTRGSAPTWVDLNGMWAVSDDQYGESILDLYEKMIQFSLKNLKKVLQDIA
ncbi:S8 family serine peptidase [Oceanobacillus senegalensis]|uniref:S8 family serine peptidase n=1 Tax=Oceanobacillus senegalensis TaxID=1936063 RepID=UPI000A310DE2|nr:S8 family serine peptidase [Oceanobacillus senegalensis]